MKSYSYHLFGDTINMASRTGKQKLAKVSIVDCSKKHQLVLWKHHHFDVTVVCSHENDDTDYIILLLFCLHYSTRVDSMEHTVFHKQS